MGRRGSVGKDEEGDWKEKGGVKVVDGEGWREVGGGGEEGNRQAL